MNPTEHEWYVVVTIIIAAIGFIVMIAYYVQQMFVSSRRQPSIEAEFLTKAEFEKHDRENREDIGRLFTILDKQGQRLAGMETAVDLNGQRLVQMDMKLDRILGVKS